jgi:RND family efflux transporter MFP subunit
VSKELIAVADPDLLSQLKIDRAARSEAPRRAMPWGPVLAGVLVLGGLWWFFGRAPAPRLVEAAVASAAATAPASASVLDASGYVVARRQATVSAKVTGKVREVLIEEGMRVEAGQVLATLDDTQQQAQHALASAQLASARSQLAETQAQLRQAEADYRRQQEINARQLGTAAQLDAARAQAEALAARLASQRRQVEVAAQSLDVAQVNLDDTVIRAPFAGVVIAKAAQPGEMISPVSAGGGFTRTGIGTIVDMGSLEVEVDVNEAYIGRVQAGMPVESTLNAYPDWKIPGQVIAVIPAADRTKATVRVRVSLDAEDTRIVPDMGVRVSFREREEAAAPKPAALTGVLLPPSAVVERDGASVVYVIEEGQAKRRPVRPGATVGGLLNIPEGLSPGAVVVRAPPADLADGAAVRTGP